MLNFEKLLEEIGEFGNYQKYAIILLQARFKVTWSNPNHVSEILITSPSLAWVN